jgi:hypothetical protein
MVIVRRGNEAPLEQLPQSLRHLMDFERFHLHKAGEFQDRFTDKAFDRGYLPQNSGAFELPCFWIRRKCLYVFGQQRREIAELCLSEGGEHAAWMLMPIHPVALQHYEPLISGPFASARPREGSPRIWAVPTASTRTVLAWPDERPELAVFVKLHIPHQLSGDRRMLLRKVACGIGFSRIAESCVTQTSKSFDVLREPIGFVPRRMQDSGVVLRSVPCGVKDGSIILAPLFALLGGSEGRRPLFPTILERSGLRADEFLETFLCRQFAHLWLTLVFQFGLVLEAHGQDLLIELSPEFAPLGRFFYRDMEGLQVDWDLRRARGLACPSDLPRACSWHETYGTWGFPYASTPSYKLRISLLQYVHLFIAELDVLLPEWHREAVLHGPPLRSGIALTTFARCMDETIGEMFGRRVPPECNLARSVNRFTAFLMMLRRELMSGTLN